jgi:hypothetical protein
MSGDIGAVVLGHFSRERVCMAVVNAYIDESNTHDGAPVLCVAGYIFDQRRAELFGEKLHPLLESKGLAYFHASECYWREDAEEIFPPLISLVKATARTGVVRFIARETLAALAAQPKVRRFAGSGYSLCVLSCMERIAQLARENGDEVLYFIEDGNEFAGELRHFLNQIKNSPEMKERFALVRADTYSKEQVIQIQAADLLAWEFGRFYMNVMTPGRGEWRDSLKNLCELPHHFSGFSEVSAWIQGMVNAFYGLETNRKCF